MLILLLLVIIRIIDFGFVVIEKIALTFLFFALIMKLVIVIVIVGQ